jgi:flagellar hook-basal body complex protein FliE
LQKLSSSEYVSSEEVVIFTHYGENKHHNIPFSVITFFFRNTRPQNFSTLIEVIKTLNSILPLVSELMENENQRKNEEINRKFEEMHTNIIDSISKSRTKAKPEMQKKLDDLTKDISEINDQIRNYFH